MSVIKSVRCRLLIALLLAVFLNAPSSLAQYNALAKLKSAGIDLELSSTISDQGTWSYLLDIRRTSDSSPAEELQRPNVFAVRNPVRLVIDVPGIHTRKAQRIRIQDPVVKSLRIGVHPNKMRVVVDLAIEYEPAFSLFKSADDFYQVSFSTAEYSPSAGTAESYDPVPAATPAQAAVQATPKNARSSADFDALVGDSLAEKPKTLEPAKGIAAPTPTASVDDFLATPPKKPKIETALATPAPTPKAEVPKSTPQPVKSTSDEAEMALAALAKKSDTQSKPLSIKSKSKILRSAGPVTLNAIVFNSVGRPPLPGVMLDISRVDKYSLLRVDRNIYELTLKNTKLGNDSLLLPQFPPESFRGLELVSAREKGEDVILRIYVGDFTRLKPFTKSKKLWLKVTPEDRP